MNLGYTQRRGADQRARRAARRNPKAASSPPTTRCSRRSRRSNPIWVPFAIPENEQLALQQGSGGRSPVAAQGQRVRRDGQAEPTGPCSRARAASTSADSRVNPATGTYRDARRDPQCRRRAQARPIRARQACRARSATMRSRCRRSRCSTARRASSSTSPTRTRTARTSQRVRLVTLGAGSTRRRKDGNLWIVESGLKPGDHVIVDGVAKLRPGAPIALGGPPGARTRRRPAVGQAPRMPHPRPRSSREGLAMFSRFFIDRPIFAAVISIFLVLAGLAAMRTLPIAQYPEIAPPVVTVQAVYPGASARRRSSKTVAAPIENAINGVPNMIYMSSNSSSSNGVVQIQVTFEIGTDIDIAAVNVNNRVKQVEPRLPGGSAPPGRHRRARQLVVPAGARVLFARRRVRRPLHVELRDAQRARPAEAAARARPTCRSSAPRTTRCGSGSSPTVWRS